MASSPALLKEQAFRQIYEALPNLLIQDPVRGCAYAISADEMEKYRTNADTWSKLNESIVSFTIPDGDAVDEVPPFLRNPGLTPSVLLRYLRGLVLYDAKRTEDIIVHEFNAAPFCVDYLTTLADLSLEAPFVELTYAGYPQTEQAVMNLVSFALAGEC